MILLIRELILCYQKNIWRSKNADYKTHDQNNLASIVITNLKPRLKFYKTELLIAFLLVNITVRFIRGLSFETDL